LDFIVFDSIYTASFTEKTAFVWGSWGGYDAGGELFAFATGLDSRLYPKNLYIQWHSFQSKTDGILLF